MVYKMLPLDMQQPEHSDIILYRLCYNIPNTIFDLFDFWIKWMFMVKLESGDVYFWIYL